MCVSKIKEIQARVTEFCSRNEMRTSGRRTDGRTDIRGNANTPRPHFVGRGIKNRKFIGNGLLIAKKGIWLSFFNIYTQLKWEE